MGMVEQEVNFAEKEGEWLCSLGADLQTGGSLSSLLFPHKNAE